MTEADISASQGYKEKIVDIREEIIRKRKAGKLPGDTTSLLKAWWQSHSKWPYPTVRLAQPSLGTNSTFRKRAIFVFSYLFLLMNSVIGGR